MDPEAFREQLAELIALLEGLDRAVPQGTIPDWIGFLRGATENDVQLRSVMKLLEQGRMEPAVRKGQRSL